MHPTTIAAIRAAMAEAGFAGAYDALAESHTALIKALDRLMIVGSAATGRLMCPFDEMHSYIEEIMKRPVWTHEMGIESIAKEIAEKAQPDFVKAIEQARETLTEARKL